jgi:uncharacterized Fe-S cluster-containing radical SAM superfamily protein
LRNHSKIACEGTFFSPQAVAQILEGLIKKYKLKYARITEGEPTLDMDHLCSILSSLTESKAKFKFILETNGLILGKYPEFVNRIAEYDRQIKPGERFIHVRVSIKGPTPDKFRLLTFADPKFHELQFAALRNCLNAGLDVHPATMLDFVETKQEIDYLAKKLETVGMSISHDIEWERLFLEDYVINRLETHHIPFMMTLDEKVDKKW